MLGVEQRERKWMREEEVMKWKWVVGGKRPPEVERDSAHSSENSEPSAGVPGGVLGVMVSWMELCKVQEVVGTKEVEHPQQKVWLMVGLELVVMEERREERC